VGTKHPATKHPSGSYFPGPCEAIFFTEKSIEREGRRWGKGEHVQYLTERFFIFIKTVYILIMTLSRCTILTEKTIP
jgi:hypothetical protein